MPAVERPCGAANRLPRVPRRVSRWERRTRHDSLRSTPSDGPLGWRGVDEGRSSMEALEFDRQLTSAIRGLDAEPDPPHTLQRLVELAPEFFQRADYAGVSLIQGTKITTPAATN